MERVLKYAKDEDERRDIVSGSKMALFEQEISRLKLDVTHNIFLRLINVTTQVILFIAGLQPDRNTGVSDLFLGDYVNRATETNIKHFKSRSDRIRDRRNSVTHVKDIAESDDAVTQVRDAVNRHRPYMFEEYGQDEDFRFADEVLKKWKNKLMGMAELYKRKI